ncbi:hypothetical protein K1X84_15105 [bacterium]|nr:hypothetical protein [bacterium]
MSETVAQLLESLVEDQWRVQNGFSDDLNKIHDKLFDENCNETITKTCINLWLQKNQPCLFGRIAAKQDRLEFCILDDADLQSPNSTIEKKIQMSRRLWTRDGFEGKKSGFIIFIKSQRISRALPDGNMKKLAQKICSLYLLDNVDFDKIYLDNIWLEKPGNPKAAWMWNTGINYFCSQADKRWWHDHRIPGGMALSINSVGHLVKSTTLQKKMHEINEELSIENENYLESKVDSLGKALDFAMRTIDLAFETHSGRATELIPISEAPPKTKCPIVLPEFLKNKSFCQYKGYYHTDITLPSEYFVNSVERPKDIKPHVLDFTYLFDENPENYDYIKQGIGRRVRGFYKSRIKPIFKGFTKDSKSKALTVKIENQWRLVSALKN